MWTLILEIKLLVTKGRIRCKQPACETQRDETEKRRSHLSPSHSASRCGDPVPFCPRRSQEFLVAHSMPFPSLSLARRTLSLFSSLSQCTLGGGGPTSSPRSEAWQSKPMKHEGKSAGGGWVVWKTHLSSQKETQDSDNPLLSLWISVCEK